MTADTALWATPIAGIHPLIWLGLFLLLGPPMLLSKITARIPGFIGATARWWQSRDPEVRGEAERARSFEIAQKEIARIDGLYEALHEDFEEQKREIADLKSRQAETDRILREERTRLSETRMHLNAAIVYIRTLTALIPAELLPEAPPELKEHL